MFQMPISLNDTLYLPLFNVSWRARLIMLKMLCRVITAKHYRQCGCSNWVPDTRLGQVPAVAIELKIGFPIPSQQQLETHLRAQLPSTHVPVLWQFVSALPRIPSMKIERAGLLKLFVAN